MSETSFSINDLLRRRHQTFLVITSLALSAASTIFLLLSAEKVGLGVSLMVEDRLTAGFSAVFSPFILLLVILILVAGAVMVSFMVSMMMSQRTRDIGLMKAIGCPSDLAFGYFFTELLIVSVLGCLLGLFLGILADFASTSLFESLGFRVSQVPFDMWLVLAVFVIFIVLALIVGAKPIFDASRIEPAKAISPTYYFGLGKESISKALSGSRLTWRIALRSLVRHKSATIRIVVCLSVVFTIVTVGVAGGLIADQTTKSWVEKAIRRDTILIAHQDVCNQYRLLLKEFVEGSMDLQFNYTSERYAVSDSLLDGLSSLPGEGRVDVRLVLETSAREVQGIILGSSTSETRTVGDSRKMETLIVGVEPDRVVSNWFLKGNFLRTEQAFEIVVGDTLSRSMFSEPLLQSLKAFERTFDVVGVCLDPIHNGKVAYVSLKTLESVAGVSKPNVVFLTVDPSANRKEFLDQVSATVNAQNPEFSILELNEILNESIGFLGYIWSSVVLLPLFSLVAASLCLTGYVILAINEQRQEFGVLRAIGARPRTVVHIISEESILVLLSSYGVGTAFGIVITLLILVQEPFVTSFTVLNIAGWLIVALVATFVASLYPAIKFAEKPLLEVLKQV